MNAPLVNSDRTRTSKADPLSFISNDDDRDFPTHLLSGQKRITLEFAGLDDNSVTHGVEFAMSIVATRSNVLRTRLIAAVSRPGMKKGDWTKREF